MTRYRRVSALLLAAALVFAMLLSSFYIALEAEHTCCGIGCHDCALLRMCGGVFGALVCVAVSVLAVRVTASAVMRSVRRAALVGTPVRLKTELRN